jgi:ABC-type glycerol-3-phosphate transport system substrate-binding protein
MSIHLMNRRQVLKLSGLAFAASALAACSGGAAPAAAPTSAPAAGATPSTVPAAQPATSGGKTSLSIATEAGPALDYQRDFAKQWADKNPDVNLRIDTITYSESQQKTMAGLAAGTLEDVVYASCKWFPLPAYKGAYRAIDDYVKDKDPGIADFFPGTIANSKFENKLYGLPTTFDNGNYSIPFINLDLFAAKGVKPPSDASTVEEFVDACAKVTDLPNKIYGTDYLCGTYYDFSQLSRTWGTDILSKDGKKFQFATDPKNTEAARWATDIRVKFKAAPLKADLQGVSQGIGFASGKLGTSFQGANSLLQMADAVSGKFKWDAMLFPKGTTGNRSFYTFSSAYCISAKSAAPEKAYDLLVYSTSKDAGVWGITHSHGQGLPRFSVWSAPEAQSVHPIMPRFLEWMKNPSGPTNFPLPDNLNYAELQDTWNNVSPDLFYGDVPFEQGMKAVQEKCQAILDKPRP